MIKSTTYNVHWSRLILLLAILLFCILLKFKLASFNVVLPPSPPSESRSKRNLGDRWNNYISMGILFCLIPCPINPSFIPVHNMTRSLVIITADKCRTIKVNSASPRVRLWNSSYRLVPYRREFFFSEWGFWFKKTCCTIVDKKEIIASYASGLNLQRNPLQKC